ncbi:MULTISPECIES: hypothetical protein [Stenotrophomonas]|uniref:hypothetical protein n=1 Tax=Stenotrophomonas TaxID=40323 RepID=UPI00201D24B2|nr:MULTISPECIES: hypothetical protein [Stenotrophomonas]MBN5026007.1 hypothetical protein [Stenotrophomonas maltophilia]MDH1273398.1 hypothetical protein [Stenotrophomonas sp. GD03937]MDH1486818.1 hypothetical protein [Stenotrophomonas sp. GD03712]UQY96963.1 hypothetical protein LZ605_06265 [Stenotrophomonas maltophilia]WON70492.1 hypothetical protein RWT08_09250 [Stenotrophomonas maltophilia]
MPTKRLALIGCLSLLAACSPQAAVSAAAVAPNAAPTAGPPPAADCPVPADVYDADDVRIYCQMPSDVQAFLARENTCQHFAGEEPYDDERRRELEVANAEYCEGREKIFTDLVARHRDDCVVRQALIAINGRYDLVFELDLKPCEG